MYSCDVCSKEFSSYRGLNGHKRIHGDSQGSYTVSRKKESTTKPFVCVACGVEKEYNPKWSTGKYCSNKCQAAYIWKTEGKPKVLSGAGGNVKKYLTEECGYQCTSCGISDWCGKPLTLQLDHIDGNSDNNEVTNLRLLCPNCHSQTETFCGRNVKNTKRNSYLREYKAENSQSRKSW